MTKKGPTMTPTLGILGGGNMAEALLRGILSSGLLAPNSIIVYDILPERLALFESLGCTPALTPSQAFTAPTVLIAVKPQNIHDALVATASTTATPSFSSSGQLFISIAAGVTTHTLESLLSPEARVIRVMPNTPLLAGCGMTALCRGSRATAADMETAMNFFRCGGDAVEVTESEMDAVTALSGSGPAYIFRFAEALFSSGEAMGLSPELSRRLAIGTIRGAAAMLERNGDAAELRRKVTSPGGTTAAALAVFERGGFEKLVQTALSAACTRSAELGRDQ